MFILLFYYKVDKVDTGHVIRGILLGLSGYDEPGFRIRDRHLLYGSWTKNTFDIVRVFPPRSPDGTFLAARQFTAVERIYGKEKGIAILRPRSPETFNLSLLPLSCHSSNTTSSVWNHFLMYSLTSENSLNPSDSRNFHTLRASCIMALWLDSVVAEKPSDVFFTMILSFSMSLFFIDLRYEDTENPLRLKPPRVIIQIPPGLYRRL